MPDIKLFLACDYAHPSMVAPPSRRLFALPIPDLVNATETLRFWNKNREHHRRIGDPIPSFLFSASLMDLPGICFFFVEGEAGNSPKLMWDRDQWIPLSPDVKKEFGWEDHAFGVKLYLAGTWGIEEIEEIGGCPGLPILLRREGELDSVTLHFDTESQRQAGLDRIDAKFGRDRFRERLLFTE